MSDHTDIRERYESGLWLTKISKRAWHEMRQRHQFQDEGLGLREAEIARLEAEQLVEARRGNRAFPENGRIVSLEEPLRSERTLGELLGVA